MYLAPINYDRFFRKVFCDLETSRRFLQDVLERPIESIEPLERRHRLTDSSAQVEFDFRCGLSNGPVIVDMQQWYKPDVAQRFYLYHAVNGALQLERIPGAAILLGSHGDDDQTHPHGRRVRQSKDYRAIEPVITLIWMVDDNLGYEDDYVSFALQPHQVEGFIRDCEIWRDGDIKRLLLERDRVIEALDNRKREMGFLARNRLVFLFQKNIVRRIKATSAVEGRRYEAWFDFAERTHDPGNREEDFAKFREDERFGEPIRRLMTEGLQQDDFAYIDSESELWDEVRRYERGIYEMGESDGQEKGRRLGLEEGRRAERLRIARELLASGAQVETVATVTGLTVEELRTPES